MRTVELFSDRVRLIDQTLLPERFEQVECRSVAEVCEAIRSLRVRGAPAIGVTAAFGLVLAAEQSVAVEPASWLNDLNLAAGELRATRPTAVNLGWALDRCLSVAKVASRQGVGIAREKLRTFAQQLADEDVAANRSIGQHGATLVGVGARILTHCNTGALATVDYGTALGVIRAAHEQGTRIQVYADETRPMLQGARLTAWELEQEGIPYTLITDSMAGHFLSRGAIDLAIVGADRIAANGDVANKIGTYSLAVLCRENGVPFYVAAPLSTIDRSIPDGAAIQIEERASDEVTHLAGRRIAPERAVAANPAFDVTPHRYVTAIVTERGIARPSYAASLAALFEAEPLAAAGRVN